MDDYESRCHSVWEWKYHVVFSPKYRRKVLYGELRRHLGEVFRTLAAQKDCQVMEGHLLDDDVHMLRKTLDELVNWRLINDTSNQDRIALRLGVTGVEDAKVTFLSIATTRSLVILGAPGWSKTQLAEGKMSQ